MKSYNEMAESVLNRRDKYIVERRKQIKKLTTAISCVCLCVLVGVGARQGGRDVMPSGTVITESSPGIEHEKGMLAVENFSSEEPPAVVGKSSIITDAPVQDETGNTGTLTHYDEVWGGSYMDTEGNWVVWLTVDTPETRAEVFQRNPTISESGTEFKKADYSLSYLTQLMADISKAMTDKQLPFVSSAALREEYNCVEVSITAENEDFIEKVRSFDTLGGAIKFRYSTSASDKTGEIVKGPLE